MTSAVNLTIKALLAEATVTTLVSTRIYPAPIPLKTTFPAISIALTGEEDERLLGGFAQYPAASVQITCHGATAKSAIELGQTVKTALRDKLFTLTDGSPAVTVARADFAQEDLDFTDYDETQTSHRRILGFSVRWR